MTQEQAMERQRRDDAYEELSKLARPELAAAKKKLGELAKLPVKDGSATIWITLNGRDVDADGKLIDRTKGYVAAGRYTGGGGLVDARAVVKAMKERAAALGLEIDPKIHRQTEFSFTGQVYEVSIEAPKRGRS